MKLWRSRIAIKLAVSLLPFGYHFWAKLGLFRHGKMDDHICAWDVLTRHFATLEGMRTNWRGLELGPGDGILSALLAPALAGGSVTLVDAGSFAHRDVVRYRRALDAFSATHPEFSLPDYSHVEDNIESLLVIAGGRYLTDKTESLKSLPGKSLDLIWSEAVLEHVRVRDFAITIREMRRLIKDDGIMSHVVDFKDHLGGALNNLRFPAWLWEREWFASGAGFYTNRYSLSQVVRIFEDAGFDVESRSIERWPCPPIHRKQLAREFAHFTDEDLCVKVAHLVARPRGCELPSPASV